MVGEPEIGIDPDSQQVVTEITERRVADCCADRGVVVDAVVIAAINRVAITGKAPILK